MSVLNRYRYTPKKRVFKSGDVFYNENVKYTFYLVNDNIINMAFPDAYKSILAWHEYDMLEFKELGRKIYADDPYIVAEPKIEQI